MRWILSSSSDPVALSIVDGTGQHRGAGAHYSRRTPGSKTFTGVGQEVVLVTEDLTAVWAVVRQRTPTRAGSGASRGRDGQTDTAPTYVWRNMMFRNLGRCLSSDLIWSATIETYHQWASRYGSLPNERLRTEIGIRKIRSTNPGYCYQMAGWKKGPTRRNILFLFAPNPATLLTTSSPAPAAAPPRNSPPSEPAPPRTLRASRIR